MRATCFVSDSILMLLVVGESILFLIVDNLKDMKLSSIDPISLMWSINLSISDCFTSNTLIVLCHFVVNVFHITLPIVKRMDLLNEL